MKDENGRSRGFGFVCMSERDEANKALMSMNNVVFLGKPLHVALMQPIEDRRQFFQQEHLMNRGIMEVPLTAATFASAALDQRKNMIGERLYPLVNNVESTWAGKITGMLLDAMDDAEQLHLLESPEDLQDKIGEAMKVIDEAMQRK